MTPVQFASWQRRLDHTLCDPRPCHDAIQCLFGEMAAALTEQGEALAKQQKN